MQYLFIYTQVSLEYFKHLVAVIFVFYLFVVCVYNILMYLYYKATKLNTYTKTQTIHQVSSGEFHYP